MIPSLLMVAWAEPTDELPGLDLPVVEEANEPPEVETLEVDETTLAPFRVSLEELTERTIGTASKPVAFNWRKTTVQLAASGTLLFEFNNYNSLRAGGLVRIPTGGTLFEVGVDYVGVWETPSSRLLALTPYRQPGRPNRMEIDFTLAVPLAEGVVTSAPKFFPAAQLVFNGYVTLRYNLFTNGWAGMRPGQVTGAIFAPALTEIEIENLDDARLGSMQVDPQRYGLLAGFGNDVYFKSGFLLSPRLRFSVPLLAPATGSDLDFWADFSLAIGWAL